MGLSAWVGGVIAARIARKETAHIQREAREHEDALIRRRDVYSRLATGMRVFGETSTLPTVADKQEFMKAYDQSCVWASETVVEKVGVFLDVMIQPGVTMDEKKAAYRECILQMRRDAGFPDSSFQFRFVKF